MKFIFQSNMWVLGTGGTGGAPGPLSSPYHFAKVYFLIYLLCIFDYSRSLTCQRNLHSMSFQNINDLPPFGIFN